MIAPRPGRDSETRRAGETAGAGGPQEPAERAVVLVGMMGSGKTTVGRLLARRLDRPFVDVDERLEAAAGRSIEELFGEVGEDGFRDQESETLDEILRAGDGAVVATGGGAVLRPQNRQRMRDAGTVIWLRARPDTLAGRVGDGAERPLLAGDTEGVLTRLSNERAAAYGEVAQLIVDVDDLDAEQVVLLIDATLAASF